MAPKKEVKKFKVKAEAPKNGGKVESEKVLHTLDIVTRFKPGGLIGWPSLDAQDLRVKWV